MTKQREQEIIKMALSYFKANLDEAKEAMDGPDVDFPNEQEVQQVCHTQAKERK